MDNLAYRQDPAELETAETGIIDDSDIVDLFDAGYPAESLHCDFVNEIEAWARHALARSGFGDY